MYVIVTMPFREIMLLQPRVALHLVHSGNDGSILEQVLHLSLVEVGDADRPHLAGLQELFHCSVRLPWC